MQRSSVYETFDETSRKVIEAVDDVLNAIRCAGGCGIEPERVALEAALSERLALERVELLPRSSKRRRQVVAKFEREHAQLSAALEDTGTALELHSATEADLCAFASCIRAHLAEGNALMRSWPDHALHVGSAPSLRC